VLFINPLVFDIHGGKREVLLSRTSHEIFSLVFLCYTVDIKLIMLSTVSFQKVASIPYAAM
jgi:hypothetical protein